MTNRLIIIREQQSRWKSSLSLVHKCLIMILLWLIIIILYSCYKVSSVLESSSSAEARLINQLPSTQPNQCCPSPLSSFAIFYPYFINPFRAYFFSTSSTFWWPWHQWYWWPSIDRGRGPLTICPVCDANPKYQSKTRKIATNTIPTISIYRLS